MLPVSDLFNVSLVAYTTLNLQVVSRVFGRSTGNLPSGLSARHTGNSQHFGQTNKAVLLNVVHSQRQFCHKNQSCWMRRVVLEEQIKHAEMQNYTCLVSDCCPCIVFHLHRMLVNFMRMQHKMQHQPFPPTTPRRFIFYWKLSKPHTCRFNHYVPQQTPPSRRSVHVNSGGDDRHSVERRRLLGSGRSATRRRGIQHRSMETNGITVSAREERRR